MPFLTQSDAASRKWPFSTGLFTGFLWSLLSSIESPLIVNRVDFIVFCALPRGGWCEGGVLLYCCMAVENRLAALWFARSWRATRASRATNLHPSGLVALGLAENRQSYVRGVTLSREAPKLQQA